MNNPNPLFKMTLAELWQLFPIVLTEHNPDWQDWYKEEKANLQQHLPTADVVRISHIGSTAVGGIWAKPIVDILLEVQQGADLMMIKQAIEQAGYLCMSETTNRLSFNKGYTVKGFAKKVFHLHLRYVGDNDELYFRDYLQTHDAVAQEYEQLKKSLWQLYPNDRDTYTEHKTGFVKCYTAKAKEMFARRYDK